MSTANFQNMEYDMPMICGRTFQQVADDCKINYGEELSEEEFYFCEQEDYEKAKELSENFTSDLMFHNITVISGYYSGFQFYVEEKFNAYFDLDKNSEYCIDNDDAYYYFDMCRSKALRAAEAEKRKIKRWLHKLTENGFNEIVCTARFSNGEACYSIVTPKTKLISVAIA